MVSYGVVSRGYRPRLGVDAFHATQPLTACGKPEVVTGAFDYEVDLVGTLAFHLTDERGFRCDRCLARKTPLCPVLQTRSKIEATANHTTRFDWALMVASNSRTHGESWGWLESNLNGHVDVFASAHSHMMQRLVFSMAQRESMLRVEGFALRQW